MERGPGGWPTQLGRRRIKQKCKLPKPVINISSKSACILKYNPPQSPHNEFCMNLKINRLENLVAAALPCCQLLPQIISRRGRGKEEGSVGESQEGVRGCWLLGPPCAGTRAKQRTERRVRRGFGQAWVLPSCWELQWHKAELQLRTPFLCSGFLRCLTPAAPHSWPIILEGDFLGRVGGGFTPRMHLAMSED